MMAFSLIFRDCNYYVTWFWRLFQYCFQDAFLGEDGFLNQDRVVVDWLGVTNSTTNLGVFDQGLRVQNDSGIDNTIAFLRKADGSQSLVLVEIHFLVAVGFVVLVHACLSLIWFVICYRQRKIMVKVSNLYLLYNSLVPLLNLSLYFAFE